MERQASNIQRGVILLELLLAAAILLGAGSLCFARSELLWQGYYKAQVRMQARLLAGNIRALQQETLFRASQYRSLKIFSQDKAAYYLYQGSQPDEKISFADTGCSDVYLYSGISTLYFSYNGAPYQNGSYKLRHTKLPNYICFVYVEPVTGRVVIDETE